MTLKVLRMVFALIKTEQVIPVLIRDGVNQWGNKAHKA